MMTYELMFQNGKTVRIKDDSGIQWKAGEKFRYEENDYIIKSLIHKLDGEGNPLIAPELEFDMSRHLKEVTDVIRDKIYKEYNKKVESGWIYQYAGFLVN